MASSKLDAQLKLLSYLQRQDDDRIVAFFPDSGNSLPEGVLFANAKDELAFAAVEIAPIANDKNVLTARLYAATRRLFSIEFDVSPRRKGVTDGTEIHIQKVTLIANPDMRDD